MKRSLYEVVWSERALDEFLEILEYILEESPAGAEIVENAVLDRVLQLASYPAMYEPDHLRENNDGAFRAFTVYHYRITYKVSGDAVIIYRIRHTSREPEVY